MGREPVQIVELVQPRCVNTYGQSPCTAEIGVIFDRKCFNTDKTCQDRANLNLTGDLKWRFVRPDANRPLDLFSSSGNNIALNPIPSLSGTSSTPTKINAGGGNRNAKPLGNRASVTVTLKDHQYDDTGSDPYIDERDYIATDRGSFWGKWLARNPYYGGNVLNIYDGYHGEALGDMLKRTYIIERIDGPDASGRVTIKANDPLRLADDQRSLVPRPVSITLRDDIDETQTTGIVLLGTSGEILTAEGQPGLGTLYSRIDDEIISYTGATESPAGQFTLSGVTRGALGTEADEHDADEQVGRVAYWSNRSIWDALKDLVELYTPIPMQYVPFADWQEVGLDFLSIFSLTGVISEPTPVVEVLGELCQQSLSYLYWDDRNQEIRFRALRPPAEVPVQLNDFAHIMAGSVQTRTDPDQRISRVVVYYGRRDGTGSIDDVANYRRVELRVDTDAEEQYNESRTRRIFSRWITSDAQAQDLATRFLSRYRDNPRFMTLRLDAKDRSLWTADPVDIDTMEVQDATGASVVTRWQVISAEEIEPGHVVQYDLQTLEFFGRFAFWMSASAPDYLDTPVDARDEPGVGFWSDEDGLMSNGDDGYKWQ